MPWLPFTREQSWKYPEKIGNTFGSWGTIGSAAPFLGLFGTVVGVLRAFRKIAETGNTGFVVVAAGISEALIATAAGIMVAVIAVVFYNYLQVRATGLTIDSNLLLESVGDTLADKEQETRESNT